MLKNSKKFSSEGKENKSNASIVKKFENIFSKKQTNSIQISCIVEDATKTVSKLRKVEHQTRNCFQTNLCPENCFFLEELQENLL